MPSENISLTDLTKPEEVRTLKDYLVKLGEDSDVVYTESAPNGSISARRGKTAVYKNGATYEIWINTDGATAWQQINTFLALLDTPASYSGAGGKTVKVNSGATALEFVTVAAATDEKVKSDSADSTADYLDGKVDNDTLKVNTTTHKIYAQHGMQLFTSSGTFTAPAGVTTVYLTMCSGGGGGGGATADGGGGGGGGAVFIKRPYPVTAGNNYNVTIGSGGSGGASGVSGTDGGNTSFDSLTLDGGNRGLATGGANGGSGGSGGVTTSGQTATTPGAFAGGNGSQSNDAGGTVTGGGGGSSYFGIGGNGGDSYGAGYAGNLYGSGGGGGGTSSAGGNGMAGFLLIEW